MPSLKKATLDQIARELRSREGLVFALLTMESGPEGRARMFASPSSDLVEVASLLLAGAYDLLDDMRPGEPGDARGGDGPDDGNGQT